LLNATVNPNGLQTSVYFEWGINTAYGNIVPLSSLSAVNGYNALSANLTGLIKNTAYHFRVMATNTDGTAYGSDMTFTTPPITITISAPADGSVIYRPDTLVSGSLETAGNETGVAVNGNVGMGYGSQFTFNHLPLASGANTISVTATDTAGNTATTAITVSTNIPYPYVRLDANTESGTAPLTVDFTASTEIQNAVASYRIDYDGNGIDDYTGSTFTAVSHTYSSPGIYYAKLTTLDSTDTAYTDTIAIVVLNGNALDSMFRDIWSAFKGKLMSQDVAGGTGYMSSSTRASYQEALQSIIAELPSIVAAMPDIELIYATGDLAKYRINRIHDIDGTQVAITYYIYFTRDADGLAEHA